MTGEWTLVITLLRGATVTWPEGFPTEAVCEERGEVMVESQSHLIAGYHCTAAPAGRRKMEDAG